MVAKFICWILSPLFRSPAFQQEFVARFASFVSVEDCAKWIVSDLKPDAICKIIASHLDKGHLAEVICDTLDGKDFAREVAGHFSASDFANYLDNEEIAQHVEVDMYDLAGRMEASEVAAHLDLTDLAREIEIDADDVTVDYTALAKALLKEFASSKVEVRSAGK